MHYVFSKEKTLHMSKKYANISYLVGSRLEILFGIALDAEPEEVILLEDYPETILIEMKFVEDIWNRDNPKPRYVRQMIAKSSLACGDVKLYSIDSDRPLYGVAIAPNVLTQAEAIIR